MYCTMLGEPIPTQNMTTKFDTGLSHSKHSRNVNFHPVSVRDLTKNEVSKLKLPKISPKKE